MSEVTEATMINPITGRKIRTSGSTFKKMSSTLVANPNLIYSLCDKDDPHVFAMAYILLDKVLPAYDPSILSLVFYPDGKWEHTEKSGKSGQVTVPVSDTVSTCSLFTASNVLSINECYMATLDTLDTWSELPRWRLLSSDDGYSFDLYFLVHAMVNQLNEIKNGNAYPVFPSNPFTKTQFTYEFFLKLAKRLKQNNIIIAHVLTVFLRDPVLTRSVTEWIEKFESAGLLYLRYDENNGFWTKKPDAMFAWTVDVDADPDADADAAADQIQYQNAELLFWLLDAGEPERSYYLREADLFEDYDNGEDEYDDEDANDSV